MSNNRRYRRVTDLFVKGRAVPLPLGQGYLWVQVINSYEREECVSDAQIARSRLILALKEAGDERTKVEARLEVMGFEEMAQDLANAKASDKVAIFADEMRDDPEWRERMEVILKTDYEQSAAHETPEETLLLAKLNAEVMDEFSKREKDEADFLMRSYRRLSEAEFIDEWVENWIERKGTAVAGAEYRLTEIWYATRFCEAIAGDEGLDHAKCDGHRERLFETKADARAAPDDLQNLIRDALDDMSLEGRDPKDSDSPESSSGSSPTPSEAAAPSPASTPAATSTTAPGT